MASPHVILQLKTSRESEQTAEAAVQLFATLPQLHNAWWYHLLAKDEQLSFELVFSQQSLIFQCYVPARLAEYVQSLVTASYKEAAVITTNDDILKHIGAANRLEKLPLNPPDSTTTAQPTPASPPRFTSVASLGLRNSPWLPLKTYQDFKDIDPLVGVLATLSQGDANDQVIVQFVVSQAGEGWKNGGRASADSPSQPQQPLIDRKLAQRGLRAAARLAVTSTTSERSQILLETLFSSFQAISHSEGNSLVLKWPYLRKQQLLKAMASRRYAWFPSMVLSLDELATLYHLPNAKLAHIPNIAWGKTLLGEPPENLPIITATTPAQEKKDINPFAKAMYKNTPTVYGIKRQDRRRHLYVIGKTGTGKSTLLANMAINDLKNDEGLCIIDPHGDLVENLLNYIPSRRINDVVYFDPSDPDRTVKINLFEGKNVVHRELIASGIVSIFQKLYAYSWGPRLEYILRNALLTLLTSDNARMSDILDLLTNDKFRAKIIANLDDPILKSFWEYEFDKMPDRQRTEAVAPILNKVGQFVSSPLIRNVVNAHKSSFSIEEIMDEGKILLVNLSQGRLGEDNATLLGAMLITKIQLAAMGRVNIPEEERRDFYLYVDEFQNFATQSFNKILSEARKYRLNLTLANQYIAQIPEEVQKAIFGNCGNIISFVMGADDAGVFEKEYGSKYTHDDLVSLDKYQIINKLSIDNVLSHPFPATTLSLAKSRNSNKEKVIKVSRERWATNRK